MHRQLKKKKYKYPINKKQSYPIKTKVIKHFNHKVNENQKPIHILYYPVEQPHLSKTKIMSGEDEGKTSSSADGNIASYTHHENQY